MDQESSIEAYPLQWPSGWRRTQESARQNARFGTIKRVRSERTDFSWKEKHRVSLTKARNLLIAEINRLGGNGVVVSTNIPVRNDGLPRATFKRPQDPGVAVYWRDRSGYPRCMACDTFDRIEDNMYALGKSIEVLRTLDRWGSSEILDRAFQGMALPAPGDSSGVPWYEVLECSATATPEEIRSAYRAKVKRVHPDVGGSDAEFNMVKNALQVGLSANK